MKLMRGSVAGMLMMLVAGFAGERLSAQGGSSTGLQPGEVLVKQTFFIVAELKPTPPNEEGATTTATGRFIVQASFAAKYVAPAPGKRRLTQFRLLSPDGLVGELKETVTYIKPNKVGEGGVTPDPVLRSESWEASSVPVGLPEFDIDIDLDAKTWTVREFGDDPQAWFSELTKAQSYVGLEFDFDVSTGKHVWKPIAFPRVPTLNSGALALSATGFANLGNPQLLSSTAGTLSGSSGGDVNTTELIGKWQMTWEIRDSAPALELRVTANGYADWRPTVKNYDPAQNVIDPGRPLSLTARVIDPSGKIPAVRIKELRWTLAETSQLPGIAMNYPYQSTDTSWDLSIAKRLPTQEKKQELVETDLTTLKSSANIWPWDHGGWSTLRVEATLDDGMKLRGKLKGPEGDETEIRLPDRAADSKIHRKWKQNNYVGAKGDNEDEDFLPLGNSSARGDGFSNFEEYRGFYVSAEVGQRDSKKQYVSTVPIFRDVFFYDQMKKADSKAAMQLFVTASGATAYVLHPGDGFMDESRVMNPNRGSGPTQGAQHAVGIRFLGPSAQVWKPMAFGNRPFKGDVIVPPFAIFQQRTPKLSGRQDLYQRHIAQSLLETCGVPKAGEGDQDYRLKIRRGADGGPEVTTTAGEVVTLRNESGHDEGEDWLRQVDQAGSVLRRLKSRGGNTTQAAATVEALKTRKYYVAAQGGQHSGPLNNIMRDTFAEAYRIVNTIILLPANHHETVGYTLSTENKADGQPNRYGDSPNPAPSTQFTSNDHR